MHQIKLNFVSVVKLIISLIHQIIAKFDSLMNYLASKINLEIKMVYVPINVQDFIDKG